MAETNKAAFVTGGARRIGRSIALTLASEGYNIALHYRSSVKAAHEVAGEIRRMGRRCELFQADFGQEVDYRDLMQRAEDALPGLQVLVNSVSIFERASLLQTDAVLYDQVLRVNLRTPFFLTQAFAQVCGQGLVVNILDTRVAGNATEHFAYTLSKKALREFTRMAAVDLAPRIRVNAVCPGLILPPLGEDEAYLQEKAQGIPLRRSGSVTDVAEAVRFFVRHPFVTGQEIFVDGGEHLM